MDVDDSRKDEKIMSRALNINVGDQKNTVTIQSCDNSRFLILTFMGVTLRVEETFTTEDM
jgi:hypothetical protein